MNWENQQIYSFFEEKKKNKKKNFRIEVSAEI